MFSKISISQNLPKWELGVPIACESAVFDLGFTSLQLSLHLYSGIDSPEQKNLY